MHQIVIEIIKGAGGEDDIGDAVIDDFTHFDDMAACTVLPPEADPSVTTTTTSTTTTHHREGSDQIVTEQCVLSVGEILTFILIFLREMF